jgi:2-polyprenyl-3-methyl-5-hydroxy-6-metoxy-1,4-benzoquinol methylase
MEYYLEYLKTTTRPPQSWYHKAKNDIVKEILGSLPPGSRVLDAGCGCGNVSMPFTGRHEIYGVDAQPEAIEYCLKNCRGTYYVSELEKLPFAEGFFDCILCMDTIEHLEKPEISLAEFRRTLKKGGLCVVATINYGNILWPLLENTWHRFFGGACKPYKKSVHPSRFTAKSLVESMGKYFAIEKVTLRNWGMETFVTARKK